MAPRLDWISGRKAAPAPSIAAAVSAALKSPLNTMDRQPQPSKWVNATIKGGLRPASRGPRKIAVSSFSVADLVPKPAAKVAKDSTASPTIIACAPRTALSSGPQDGAEVSGQVKEQISYMEQQQLSVNANDGIKVAHETTAAEMAPKALLDVPPIRTAAVPCLGQPLRPPPGSPLPDRILRTPPESPSGWVSSYATRRSDIPNNSPALKGAVSRPKSRSPSPVGRTYLSPSKPAASAGGGGYSSPAHLQLRRHQLLTAAPPSPTPTAMAVHSYALASGGKTNVAGFVNPLSASPLGKRKSCAMAGSRQPTRGLRTACISAAAANLLLMPEDEAEGSQDLSGFDDGEWEATSSIVGGAAALSERDGTEMLHSPVGTQVASPCIISPHETPATAKSAVSSALE